MVWYGMVWYGMVWYGMVGMVWYGLEGRHGQLAPTPRHSTYTWGLAGALQPPPNCSLRSMLTSSPVELNLSGAASQAVKDKTYHIAPEC
jgi:hypothetical protein